MKKDLVAKLKNLQKKKEILDARIQKLNAIQKTKERKIDTRKKILVGSYYLDKAIKENTYEQIVNLMDGFLIRDSDRKVFNLILLNQK